MTETMIIRPVEPQELSPALFADFLRFQEVTRCWRKVDGQWQLLPIAFIDDWDGGDHRRVCGQLSRVLAGGGAVWGAFSQGALKGFASVEAPPIGSRSQYAVLAELHVSRDFRRHGLGRKLFALAAGFARKLGAEKLYISAMSAEESQAFYRAMGCVEAEEYDPPHVEREPCDCQMEFSLSLLESL